MTSAAIGHNTILKKGDGGTPEAFTDYGLEITSINGVGFSRDAIDATHMQSTGAWAEMIFGVRHAKPITVEFNLIPSAISAIQTILDGAIGNWQILLSNNTSLTFAAGLSDFDLGSLTPEGKMSSSVVLTPTGAYTWA